MGIFTSSAYVRYGQEVFAVTRHELYPSWVKLNYTTRGRSKVALLPCAIDGAATPGIEPSFTPRAGAPIMATTAVSAYCTAASHVIGTSGHFDSYEVYHKAALDADPVLVYASVLAIVGLIPGDGTEFSEAVWTFKTPSPGGLKIYIMEGSEGVDLKKPLPIPTDPDTNAIPAYIMSDDNWILGRNGNQPILPLFMTSKQNDHYRRKYKL